MSVFVLVEVRKEEKKNQPLRLRLRIETLVRIKKVCFSTYFFFFFI